MQLTDQGHDALLRYRDDPRKEDVTVYVGHFEDALSLGPNDNHCRAAALCNLAMAHFINCRIDRGHGAFYLALSKSARVATCWSPRSIWDVVTLSQRSLISLGWWILYRRSK